MRGVVPGCGDAKVVHGSQTADARSSAYRGERAAAAGFRPPGWHQRLDTPTVASESRRQFEPAPPASFIPMPNLLASAVPPTMYRLHLARGMSLEIGSGGARPESLCEPWKEEIEATLAAVR